MQRYKYRAINSKGRPAKGVISALNEVDLHNQLQKNGMELVQCALISEKKGGLSLLQKKVKLRDLIQLFIHMEQMQGAGVPLLSALADIRDTTDQPALRDIMADINRDVAEGASLTEAMAKHPKVFTNLYLALISAGEETGDLPAAYRQLIKYLKWVDLMQTKIRKATRYPMIVGVVVILTIVVMMGVVVPQIVGFIKNMDQEIPWYTASLMATSDFFVNYWWAVLLTPVVIFIAIKTIRKLSDAAAFTLDSWMLNAPVVGPLLRKINVARFSQTFGALYSSGIDVLRALDASRRTVTNLAMAAALETVIEEVRTGSPLSEAFNKSGEFPSLVTRMLKVGEESGNLTPVLDQVSDFYTSDVDEAISGLIAAIEPSLTGLLGGMILWIAAGVFGPIYASFEHMNF